MVSMESVDGNGCGGGLVVTELSHIKELVKQLEVHLGGSADFCKHLTSEISSVTERSIVMIKSGHFGGGRKRGADSLPSATPSPLSGVSNMPFKGTKKRKTMEKRKNQVRVSSPEAETPVVEDGHSWRKYGQKEILGAKHPRGYYRCTHRNSQNCLATKQVQRTDGDPTLFDVIYHGEHTCGNKTVVGAEQAPEQNASAHALLQSLSASLTVKTEGLHAAAAAAAGSTGSWAAMPPFCFSSPVTPDECFFAPPPSSSPLSPSPATSGSVFGQQAHGEAERRANAEYQEVVSALVAAATSAPPEPEFDMDAFVLNTNFSNIDVSTFFDDFFAEESR